ncbi:spherulation-specific family 4 protein [Actinomycetes bacterium KLBMP 9797]
MTTQRSNLANIDLEYGERPLADVLDQIESWATRAIDGVFLDRAPADLPHLGAVALAVRVSRRHELGRIVLNPGGPVDPRYRELDVEICTFAGDWGRYQRWSGEGSRPGDGHLVYAVPPAQHDAAHRLIAWRGAGFALVTAAPYPHDQGVPPRVFSTGWAACCRWGRPGAPPHPHDHGVPHVVIAT